MTQLFLPGMKPRIRVMRKAYAEGWEDYKSNRWRKNPYTIGTISAQAWTRGWSDASKRHASIVLERARERGLWS